MIVIADDITGAAEMAGIAHVHGLRVRLLCSVVGEASKLCSVVGEASKLCSVVGEASKLCKDGQTYAAKLGSFTHYDVLVIATDTRSMTETEAEEETRRLVSSLSSFLSPLSSLLLFKKTDSALRGHVVAELKALMAVTGYRRAVFMPSNPSKGRIIKDGVYYIKEVSLVPLHETAFSYDPEFPALTSSLVERFPDAAENGIIMPDAETIDDIRSIVARYNDGHTLFAGAADLFREIVVGEASLNGSIKKSERFGLAVRTVRTPSPSCSDSQSEPFGLFQTSAHRPQILVLCGSTQSRPQAIGFPESPMPLAIYDGSDDLQPWLADALTKYEHEDALMLTIPHHHRTGRATAIHLRTVMAEMARQIVGHAFKRDNTPDAKLGKATGRRVSGNGFTHYLIIEGGATAWATFQALGWTQFDILQELAPGIVQMRAVDGTIVTLKPGSYPWRNLFSASGQTQGLSLQEDDCTKLFLHIT